MTERFTDIETAGWWRPLRRQGEFLDRQDAGKRLAHLARDEWLPRAGSPLILALPRGGVPVAFEIASTLRIPMDVFLVRKLGVPGHEELAMGAIAAGGVRVLNPQVVDGLGLDADIVEAVAAREAEELARRDAAYRPGRPPLSVAGRDVLLVDDGIATGATMLAALQALEKMKPASLAVAVPVAPPRTIEKLRAHAAPVLCLSAPEDFASVGEFYADFRQTTDEEVLDLLQSGRPLTT